MLLTACNEVEFDLGNNEGFPSHIQSTNEEETLISVVDPTEETQEEDQEVIIQSADCYEDGIHPVAQIIAEEYNEATDYDEVMVWFCNGAEFEDITSALFTEEMMSADPDELLRRLADGETWDDIWLDLGIVED